ncbi:hypothetical protein AB1Y20_002268 [Prymnesium parvum]|uniref:BTB domain-containing protein n=1 Tax=Prymnesium parvum TaxID=97485 RepID=A0AB34J9X2_PRYPA
MDPEHRVLDDGGDDFELRHAGVAMADAELEQSLPSASSSACRWTPVQFCSRSPGSRVFPSAVMHNKSLHIFGGHDGTAYRNDLLVFSLETYAWMTDFEVVGEGPSPRDAHAAVAYDEWMYVFGGYDSKRYLNDFHRFHFETNSWTCVNYVGGGPSPRGGHTAIVYNDTMVVFGGCDGWNYFNDCYRFCFISSEWTAMRVTGTAPGARSAPATVVHEGRAMMYVFGGYDGARSLNDLFRFDLATSEWSQVRVTGIPPSPRGGHTAVVYGGTMYAFGGKSGRSPFNDLCGFNFERGTWERVQVQSNAPAPRCAHVCVVYGHSLFVFGGYDGRRYFEDCFELSFQTLTSTHILSLAGDLEPMVDSEHFSDISFLVEGRTIFAHKFILFARCEYFRRMFTSGYKESTCSSITIPDVSYDVFLIVLTFLYTGKPREISLETAVEVMSLANLYGIDPLKRICAEVVTAGLNVQNAAYVLHAADTYQAAQLRAKCLNFMVTNFAQVVRTEAFKELITKESSALVLHFLEEASSRLALSD